ncbi:MAG TPA: histidine kinase [Ilumatobacter sp.]|nr:histidine kinase [Ilumatobacter sp.]
MEPSTEPRSFASLLRLGVAVVLLAAFFVDSWVFGTFPREGWLPDVFDGDYSGGVMAVPAGVLLCGLVWAGWPRTTPFVAVAASLGSLVLSVNLDGHRSRFPFFTEAVVLIVVLGAVLWRRAAWSWPVAALVVVAGEAISLRAGSGGIRNVLAATLLVLFAAVVTAVVYSWMKDDERRLGIEEARRNERLELARELHDIVGHHVTGIVVLAQASRFTAAHGGAGAGVATDRTLADIERAGIETLTSVRRLVALLREDAPTAAGPQLADVEMLVGDLRATHPGAAIEVDAAIRTRWVPADLETTVHRLVQEATTNVRKHGAPDGPVTVALSRTAGSIKIEVRNRRLPGAARAGSGYGLVGMRERVEALGGVFSAGSSGDDSWVVRITLPVAGAA